MGTRYIPVTANKQIVSEDVVTSAPYIGDEGLWFVVDTTPGNPYGYAFARCTSRAAAQIICDALNAAAT